MSDYKATLNLPKTAFPMKANLPQREPEVLARWQQLDLYQKLRQQGTKRESYIFHDGPPYANARPHMGTAMNKTLKDIVVKSKTLGGFDAPFVPGWDCHGLPIELNVEKKVGKPGVKLSHQAFRQACREYALKQVDLQREDFKRIGVIADWDNPYLTINPKYEANLVRGLAKIMANGHLQRGQKPVHWCSACGSALAEAEVEYKDKSSSAIDVAFEVIDTTELLAAFACQSSLNSIFVPIWTTTPWTLPANEAVSVHADLAYVLLSYTDGAGENQAMVVAKDLMAAVLERYAVDDYEVLAEANGQALENIKLQHPFLSRQVPIILGEHVTTDAGTGNVHTAPAHGQEDYVVAQQYQLPINNPVDSRSCFIEGTPVVAGMHVTKVNEPIIEVLKQNKKLLHLATIEHSYPHCWRHKTPLIFRATPQWFVSMSQANLQQQALAAIEKVKWLPSWGKTRIHNMLAGRPDWCISRQRTWGTPITLFIHKKTGEIHPQMPALMEKIALLMDKDGMEAWHDLELKTLLGDEAGDYEKTTDTLDVWFDSGMSHACVLAEREGLDVPADLYLEGSDQHRGWFQTSLLTSLALHAQAPYKTVLTHGYVVDAKGHKMSKSLGNVVSPIDVVKRYGADVLRLWVAAANYRDDLTVSDEILKRSADAYRRIRNTTRFLLSNLYDFNPEKDQVPFDDMLALDRWVVDRAHNLQQKVIAAYDDFQFHHIYQDIHNFCAVTLGSFYLDILKDRQYTCKSDGRPRRSSQTAMYLILEALVRWIAPILSFTAEEIWQHMPGERGESVFLDGWYKGLKVLPETDPLDADFWQQIQLVRDEVNKVLEARRKAGDIGSALDANVTLYVDEKLLTQLQALGEELRFVLITSAAQVLPEKEKSELACATEMPGLRVQVDVSRHNKCERCWQHVADVGENAEHATICGRCVANVYGEGEQRQYA